MIFDKNQYRANELCAKLKKESDPDKRRKIQKRIAALAREEPDYWIKFYDDAGRPVSEKVPLEYRGKRGAEKYEGIRKGQIETGTFSPKSLKAATINEICDFYMNGKMLGKPGYSAAKTSCKSIKTHLGSFRLRNLLAKPDILSRHFTYFPEPEWAPKYIWNYRATLRAAIQFWIDTKELIMVNPVDRAKIDKNIRKGTVPSLVP